MADRWSVGMVPSEFLAAVFPDWTQGLIALWRGDTKKTAWIATGELDRVDQIEHRCRLEPGANLYFGIGIQRSSLGEHKRGDETDVIAIPGLWADLDFADARGVKQSTKQYPPRDVAEKALDQMPLMPSMCVETGGGLHVYWLFQELLQIDNDHQRTSAKQMAAGWQSMLADRLRKLGGYAVDSTADLSRILRPAGSWNFRHACEVTVGPQYVDPDLWKRYEPADFEAYAKVVLTGSDAVSIRYQVGDLILDPSANVILEKYEALLENSSEFKQTWTHKRSFPSNSECEASLASIAARALWTDQEIANLLITHRRKWEPVKLPKLTERPDYIARVISLVRGDRNRDSAIRALNDGPLEPDELTGPINPDDPTPKPADERSAILDRLSAVFGVHVQRWIQLGTEKPVYSLVLAGGREIRIGSVASVVTSEKSFVEAIYAETGHLMESVGKKAWRGVCEALAKICEVIDAPDATDAESARAGIATYLSKKEVHSAAQRSDACCLSAPFVEGKRLHVCIEPLRKWLNFHSADKWQKKDLLESMRRIGFEHHRVSFTGSNGTRTSRSYWSCDADQFSETIGIDHQTAASE